MSRYTMTIERALVMVRDVAEQRRRWGKQVSPPYTMMQLLEALELLDNAGCFEQNAVDAAKLRRQLQASNARETRLKQQLAEHSTESKTSQDGDAGHDVVQS